MALLVIAAAQLLMVMDGTIVTAGLPVIGNGLSIAEADLDWVLTAYALTFGGLLLAGGRAGDLFGRRRLLRAGLVVFLLGGLAGNGSVLIAARVLQGVGATIVAPAALSLLADTFPAGPQRNKALGVYGAMGGLGSVVGLLLGGALTQYLGWRWIMFVNIPIALVVLAGTPAVVSGTRERGGIDLPGAGGFYLAAVLAAVLLLRPRPTNRDTEPTPETLGSTPGRNRPPQSTASIDRLSGHLCLMRPVRAAIHHVQPRRETPTMTTESRLPNPAVLVPELKDIGGVLYRATGNGTIPQTTISLVQLRAGQIVGSTYLTVLHTGNLRKAGATEESITAVASWRDAPYFTAAERIALELVESVLTPNPSGERVPDELYARAAEQYDDKALATLIMAIGQVCFFLPLALIGKPLPGVSPAEQWRP